MKTKTEAQHTPTPWNIEGKLNKHQEGLLITSRDGLSIVAEMSGGLPFYEVEDNAAFIVRAVNCHEALLEALDAYVTMHDKKRFQMPEDNENEGKIWRRIRDIAQQAISKAAAARRDMGLGGY